ncbi:MAG: NAD-binding protein [Aquiluna sp.]|nr:NAD-binding protein [Aquiluna sp.]
MRNFFAVVRYRFDNLMSKGLLSLIGLLTLVTAVFVLLMTVLVMLFSSYPVQGESVGEMIWFSLMHALDPGTVVGAEGLAYRAIMLITTFGGLVFLAGLIGIVSGAFDTKVEELRKGRSRVIESDHTLILGWNSRVFSLVKEISLANLSRKKASIVILAPGDKVEMEDAIKEQVGRIGKTRVIVRSGDPMSLADLEIASHATARSIIILAADEAENADLVTMKTALALVNNPNRPEQQYHIVAELQELENLERAQLVSAKEVKWILAGDVMSRIMVQTSRQSGLSQIFLDLLDFDGDEIYFTQRSQLVGKSYLQAQHEFSNATLIGVLRDGDLALNPARTMKIKEGDQLIVIAPDDSLIRTSDSYAFDKAAISNSKIAAPKPEKALILGQNENLPVILSELEQYVAKGSSVTLVSDQPKMTLAPSEKLKVTFVSGDPTLRAVLDRVKVQSFDHIIVLANRELSAEESDAITLITLLQLRAIAAKSGKSFNIVTEMLDDKNRQLAESAEADDFIVSDQLIGLMMSQISENPDLAEVFGYLFSSEGSEISLHPASWYVKLGETVDMHVLIEAAAKRGETAIGYRKADLESSQQNSYGVALNPEKVRRFKLVEGDKVIVLAEG